MTIYIMQCENCDNEFSAAPDQCAWMMVVHQGGTSDLEPCVYCPDCEEKLDPVLDVEIDLEEWAIEIVD